MIGKQQTGKKGTADKGSYRTAWYMLQRIAAAMQDGDFKKLTGVVEIDETYVGGKAKSRHRSQQRRFKGKAYGGKVGVIGAISRKGNVTARIIEKMDSRTAQTFVDETVASTVELVATDDHPTYDMLNWGPLRTHESVSHSAGEYVRGTVHTANLDAFWALLKRGIMGTFHQVSKKYLPLYVQRVCLAAQQPPQPGHLPRRPGGLLRTPPWPRKSQRRGNHGGRKQTPRQTRTSRNRAGSR